jgi:hypothetical protein
MTTRTRSLRRAATGAALTSVLFAGLAALVAPSAAAEPTDPSLHCLAGAIDGVHVCTPVSSGPPPYRVLGSVFVDNDSPDVTISGALVVLERCTDSGCSVVATTTGQGKGVSTPVVEKISGSRYVTTASWVDNLGRQHHGVRTG